MRSIPAAAANVMEENEEEEVPMLVECGAAIDEQDLTAPAHDEPASSTPTPASSTTPASSRPPVPLTILTGFLGAGKTTLLHHLLREFGSRVPPQRIGIVQNETTEMGVEIELIASSQQTQYGRVIELKNGCVCCSVQSELLLALQQLVDSYAFDYLVVECSGLADPGPVIAQVWTDKALEDKVYLDGVVTVLDATYLVRNTQPDRQERAQVIRQLAYADRIIVNKRDLMPSEEHLQQLLHAVRQINSSARILVAERSLVAVSDICSIHAFDESDTMRAVALAQLDKVAHEGDRESSHEHHHEHERHEHEHVHDEHCKHSATTVDAASMLVPPHDHSITSLVLECTDRNRRVSLKRLREWLASLLWSDIYLSRPGVDGGEPEQQQQQQQQQEPQPQLQAPATSTASNGKPIPPPDVAKHLADVRELIHAILDHKPAENRPNEIFRLKGIVHAIDNDEDDGDGEGEAASSAPWFIQAVQELFEVHAGHTWPATLPTHPMTRIVVMGRRLDLNELRRGFDALFV